MKTDREVMQQALEALDSCDAEHPSDGGRQWYDERLVEPAIAALRARLAEPETCKPALQVEAEPVAWFDPDDFTRTVSKPTEKEHAPLYTHPPRRPLADEEIWDIAGNCLDSVAGRLQFARAIERAHKIGGAQ